MINTVDRNVEFIAISLYQLLGLHEMWTELGNGINMRCLPVHEYAFNLGTNKCQALPVSFAFTGCDILYFLVGGKILDGTLSRLIHLYLENLDAKFVLHSLNIKKKLGEC